MVWGKIQSGDARFHCAARRERFSLDTVFTRAAFRRGLLRSKTRTQAGNGTRAFKRPEWNRFFQW